MEHGYVPLQDQAEDQHEEARLQQVECLRVGNVYWRSYIPAFVHEGLGEDRHSREELPEQATACPSDTGC